MSALARRWAAMTLLVGSPASADRDSKRTGSKVLGPDSDEIHAGIAERYPADIAKIIEERALVSQRTAQHIALQMGEALSEINSSSASTAAASTASRTQVRHVDKKALKWDADGYCCSESTWDDDATWCYLFEVLGTCNEFGFPRTQPALSEQPANAEKATVDKAKVGCGPEKRNVCKVSQAAPSFSLDPTATNCICMHAETDEVINDAKLKVSEFEFDSYDKCIGVTATESTEEGLSVDADNSCQTRCSESTSAEVTVGEAVFANHKASACILPKGTTDVTKEAKSTCMCVDFASAKNVTKTAVPVPDRIDPKSTALEDAQRLASCYAACPKLCQAKSYKHGFCVVPRSDNGQKQDNAAFGSARSLPISILAAIMVWVQL